MSRWHKQKQTNKQQQQQNNKKDVLARVSITEQNIMTKKQVGEEMVYSAYTSTLHSSPKEVRTGTHTGQKPGGRSWYRCHGGMLLTGLLLLACSACFLTEASTTSPGMAPPTTGPPTLDNQMPPWDPAVRHFLKGGSFLCDNSSLCQIDTQNQ